MKLTIVTSSQRKDSESRKVAEYIKRELSQKESVSQVLLIDLLEVGLPFFDDTLEENEAQQALWNPVAKELSESDGFVFITPEWNGMASPMLKNFFMYIDAELAQKPALLVSVSSNPGGGAYPIAELRLNSHKNTFVCYIPNHVIVRNVKECLNDIVADPENKADVRIRERIDHSLNIIVAYSKALREVRLSSGIDWTRFEHGM